MPVYVYKAVTDHGLIVRNKVEDINKSSIIKKLKRNNLMPISIIQLRSTQSVTRKKKRNVTNISEISKNFNEAIVNRDRIKKKESYIERINMALSKTEKITSRDIVIFTQNFYLLKKANFNNIHALSTVIETTENYTLKQILQDILAGVEMGENMYTTMEYYEGVFPPIYINMIKVGEQSGSLTQSLEQAVKYLDDTESMNKKLRKIIVPNLTMFVALLIMLVIGTVFAVPAIQELYKSMGSSAELPAITMWFSGVIDGIMAYWYIPVIVIAGIAAVIISYINTPKGKYNFHHFKYKMPVFGQLIFAIDFSRFVKAMLLNLQNGMRVQDALEVSKNITKNLVMLSLIETAINNILIGESWIEPFERSGFASPMIVEMLKIGMQTSLGEMMEKLVEYMDIDIQNTIEKVMKILPEIVYAIVGVVLIFFVLVVLVPCIDVYMGGWLFDTI